MCWERPSICSTKVLTLARGSQLMDQRWSHVPEQVAMSPVRSLTAMAAQLADECEARQVQDDGRPVARTRHEDLVGDRCGQTCDGLRVPVEVLPDRKLFPAQVSDGDDRVGSARHDGPSCGADAGENLLVVGPPRPPSESCGTKRIEWSP